MVGTPWIHDGSLWTGKFQEVLSKLCYYERISPLSGEEMSRVVIYQNKLAEVSLSLIPGYLALVCTGCPKNCLLLVLGHPVYFCNMACHRDFPTTRTLRSRACLLASVRASEPFIFNSFSFSEVLVSYLMRQDYRNSTCLMNFACSDIPQKLLDAEMRNLHLFEGFVDIQPGWVRSEMPIHWRHV